MLSFHGVSSFEFHFWLKSNGFAFLPHSMFPTSSHIFNYSSLDIHPLKLIIYFTTASGWDLSCCLSSLLPLSALNFYLKLLFWLLLLLSDPFLHPSHLQTRQLPLSNPILPPHRTLAPNIWEIINMVNLIFTQKYFSSALVSFWIYLTVSEITKPILIGFLLLVCIKWSYVFSQSAPSNKHTANLACLKT